MPSEKYCRNRKLALTYKIYTLGRFTIATDVASLVFPQKKPLDMLKTIIAFGCRNICKMAVSDALWPDSDGDNASQAFSTTLHRLRRLLGNDQAELVQDGTISLNFNFCWLDCLDSHRLINFAEKAALNDNVGQAIDYLERAEELYKGPFLSQDENLSWLVSKREQLANTFLSALMRLCDISESEDQMERAVAWYQRSLEVGDLFEGSYQHLLVCLLKLGRKTEAISTYKRCQKNLAALFGTEPSPKTEAIYLSLMNG